jgi:hypothetical protein
MSRGRRPDPEARRLDEDGLLLPPLLKVFSEADIQDWQISFL